MLIISKFHDYYDTAISMGIDKECVFNRQRHEEKMTIRMEAIHLEEVKAFNRGYTIDPFVIGFAGEFYPGVKIIKTWMQGFSLQNSEDYFYNVTEWEEYLSRESIVLPHSRWNFYKNIRSLRQADEFFNPKTWTKQSGLFRKYNTPIFVMSSHGKNSSDTDIIINPTLMWYRFGKVKDAYTAFQDIHMYISGVLGVGERKMIQLSDEDKRDKKGFDIFSFKKRKK